ncbi:MAG: RNA methyltransferase [Actinobacteria bacterium]|nr:RNA methyltransferase [Actinomycetota bacterium]NBY14928.1 RNA methyltransferase [Actinomycetota bacterium]
MTYVETNVRALKVVRARRLLESKFRAAQQAFLAEGPQAVREAINSGLVRELFITEDSADRYQDILQSAQLQAVEITLVIPEVIEVLASAVTPQGMVAIVNSPDSALESVLNSNSKLVVALASVRDPGNAGSVIRVADAVAADGVLTTTDSVELQNPKVVRSTAGSLFHLPCVEGVDLHEAIARARLLGLQVLAADGSGEPFDVAADLTKPTLWIFGNEAWGLPQDLLNAVDQVVAIPIYGKAESLNLATATAVCLYASASAQRSTNS